MTDMTILDFIKENSSLISRVEFFENGSVKLIEFRGPTDYTWTYSYPDDYTTVEYDPYGGFSGGGLCD